MNGLYAADPDSTRGGGRERPTTTTTGTPKSSKAKEERFYNGGWVIRFIINLFTNDEYEKPDKRTGVVGKEKTTYRYYIPEMRGYLGASIGGVSPVGFMFDDYEGGIALRLTGGVHHPSGFGGDLMVRYIRFHDSPMYIHHTTTRYPNGDIRYIKSVPVDATMTMYTMGAVFHHTWYYQNIREFSVTGIRVSVGGLYTFYSEKAGIIKETYINGEFQSRRPGRSRGSFLVPSIRLEVGANYSFSSDSPWLFEISLGYEHSIMNPSYAKPLYHEWTDFTGQLGLSVGVRYRLF